jgi:hypothetical protein
MQLVQPEPAFLTHCVKCARPLDSVGEAIYADLDGAPFHDYYCRRCMVRVTQSFEVGMAL